MGYDCGLASENSPRDIKGLRLREEYEKAKLRHEWAVSEMARQRETGHGEAYNRLMLYVQESRAEMTEALRALRSFEAEHPKK